jgi:transcriptional regulator with XRE-family HTH domain
MSLTIGERIKALREERRLSQAALATKSALQQPFLSKVEQGLKKPSPQSIDKIASALGIGGQTLAAGTDCEGTYFTARLSTDENRKRSEARAFERATLLNVFSAWYDRIRHLFEAIHEGYFYTSSPAIEDLYQFVLRSMHEYMRRISDFVPDIEDHVHLPETTDIHVRAGGVEDDLKGIEEEGIWEYIDQPAMAKTALYLRQLRAADPACVKVDIEPLIAAHDKSVDALTVFDDSLESFRAHKRRNDKILMDRMIAVSKEHLEHVYGSPSDEGAGAS